MYRTRFTAPTPQDGRRRWVTLDGIFYQADVWLDGAYLGDPEGYFFPHSFDITDLSRFDDEHVLAVEVTCAPQSDPAVAPQHHRACCSSPSGSTGRTTPAGCGAPCGSTTPGRCASTGCGCCAATPTPVGPICGSRPGSTATRSAPVVIRTMIDGHPHAETTQVVATGQNDLEWSIDLTDPALWWPRSLGAQPLTMVDGRGVRRRGTQRSPTATHRAPPGELGRLGLLGERRTTLPEGRQHAADEQRLRRRPPAR